MNIVRVLLISAALFAVNLYAARTPAMLELDRQKAYQLADDGKRDQAISLLKALLKELPDDGGLNFRYGYLLYLKSVATGKDGRAEKKMRREARKHLEKAEKSGLDQPLVQNLLGEIKADGSIEHRIFSKISTADEAMREGELAFQQRDFPRARVAYQRALTADSGLAEAALYMGDTFYVEQQHAEAQTWFIKAIQIDPNLEQAYRYLGDSLWVQGRHRDALEQYVESIIAWPYRGLGWNAMRDRAQSVGRLRSTPTPDLPDVTITVKDGATHLNLNGTVHALSLAYATARAAWLNENAKECLEGRIPYRQTLAEETEGLRKLVLIAQELQASAPKDEKQMPPEMLASIARLAEIDKAGLLQPHILITRANRDLAQDYAAFRDEHRNKLREYFRRFIVNLD